MPDDIPTNIEETPTTYPAPRRRRAAERSAGPPREREFVVVAPAEALTHLEPHPEPDVAVSAELPSGSDPVSEPVPQAPTAPDALGAPVSPADASSPTPDDSPERGDLAPGQGDRRARPTPEAAPSGGFDADGGSADRRPEQPPARPRRGRAVTMVTFQAPDPVAFAPAPWRRRGATPFEFDETSGEPVTGGTHGTGAPGSTSDTAPTWVSRGSQPGSSRCADDPDLADPAGSPHDIDDRIDDRDARSASSTAPDGERVFDPSALDPSADDGSEGSPTRRRRRGRRGRGRARADEDAEAFDDVDGGGDTDAAAIDGPDAPEDFADGEATGHSLGAEGDDPDDDGSDPAGGTGVTDDGSGAGSSRRRRRRRRRDGGAALDDAAPDDPPVTVVHVRDSRVREDRTRDDRVRDDRVRDDEVRGVNGSTRLEAKRQRRREGRDSGRRRPPIVTEAEFLARREAVERRMVVRNAGDRTQIAVLEDGILVEHFVTRASSSSYAGNVYLGRVQNVLASMEAAFVDIGKGRNAVLYAGEVNYDASGLDGRPRKIEQVLKSGQSIVVQVSKDPIGHKGARLTSQVSLPGRYLVYVPDGQNAGISRKLPDTERARLKAILKKITPENGGVIVRTAAEGASEQELARDVARLSAQWGDICRKAAKATAPSLLYGEPDLVIRVIRDIFNEDFAELVVQGAEEATMIEDYVDMVAPDLRERVRRHTGPTDVFADHRVDEQLAKALERKVWLPSGGSLVIDRTEAMTVIDVNTGKFTGKGGNLEETVTKNNLEAAEEIVRQLRLRDIGGIIVIDFIDMVLESNRELVLRRLTECLGRDRTRHQVAEVTSLGLVQMTRKRVGQGLLEAYSEPCAHCAGRGVILHLDGDSAPPARATPPAPFPASVTSGSRVSAPPAPPGAQEAVADEVVADEAGVDDRVAVATSRGSAGVSAEPGEAPAAAPGDAATGPACDANGHPVSSVPESKVGGPGHAARPGTSSTGSRASGVRTGRRRASRAVAAPQDGSTGGLEPVAGSRE